MDKIDVITARPAKNLLETTTEPKRHKNGVNDSKYLSTDTDFDGLTIAAWSETTMKPYASEHFKIESDDAETRRQLKKIDDWIVKEMEAQGLEPTLRNYKKVLKDLNMVKGIKTLEDFISKVIEVEEPEADTFGKKQSTFVSILKGLINLMEEK